MSRHRDRRAPFVGSVRRYYLSQRVHARRAGEHALAAAWAAKQEAEPGSRLTANVPYRAELERLGYSTTEDLLGADEDELADAGLNRSRAVEVITAMEQES